MGGGGGRCGGFCTARSPSAYRPVDYQSKVSDAKRTQLSHIPSNSMQSHYNETMIKRSIFNKCIELLVYSLYFSDWSYVIASWEPVNCVTKVNSWLHQNLTVQKQIKLERKRKMVFLEFFTYKSALMALDLNGDGSISGLDPSVRNAIKINFKLAASSSLKS